MTFEEWGPRVSAYLNGKTQPQMTMDVVRGALGRTYDQMRREDWGTLADAIIAAGWRKKSLGKGVSGWERPAGHVAAPAPVPTVYCSFCGKSRHDVRKLVGGAVKTVFICNECVELCADLCRGAPLYPKALSAPSPAPAPDVAMIYGEEPEVEVIDLLRPPISFRPVRKTEPGIAIRFRGIVYSSRLALALHLSPMLGKTVAAVQAALMRRGDDAEAVVHRYQHPAPAITGQFRRPEEYEAPLPLAA
jgi:hypothetical protein